GQEPVAKVCQHGGEDKETRRWGDKENNQIPIAASASATLPTATDNFGCSDSNFKRASLNPLEAGCMSAGLAGPRFANSLWKSRMAFSSKSNVSGSTLSACDTSARSSSSVRNSCCLSILAA